jgi:hypothetical protein
MGGNLLLAAKIQIEKRFHPVAAAEFKNKADYIFDSSRIALPFALEVRRK